jgi:hypothetical protein
MAVGVAVTGPDDVRIPSLPTIPHRPSAAADEAERSMDRPAVSFDLRSESTTATRRIVGMRGGASWVRTIRLMPKP